MTTDERREERRVELQRRRRRALAVLCLVSFLVALGLVLTAGARSDDPPPPPPPPTYEGLSAEEWAAVASAAATDRDAARSKLARRERELRRTRRTLRKVRASLRERVQVGGSGTVAGLLCIHRFEGAWDDPRPPFWGGLQMDLSFQRTYGGPFLRSLGTADRWPPFVQLAVALSATYSRGFSPWPNTRRSCGI